MEEAYTIAMEIKSETYFGKGLFLFDLGFIGVYWFLMSNFEFLIHPALVLPYNITNVLFAFYLTRKSRKNPQKRVYQSIIFGFLAAKNTKYHVKERTYHEIEYREDIQ